jgi:hypothetical protein
MHTPTPRPTEQGWDGCGTRARMAGAQAIAPAEEQRHPTHTVGSRGAANCAVRGPKPDLHSVDDSETSMRQANANPAHDAHSLPMKESIQDGRLDLLDRSPLAVGEEHLISALGRQPLVHHEGAEIALFEQALEIGSGRRGVDPWIGRICRLGFVRIGGYGDCCGNKEGGGGEPNDRGRISVARDACVHRDVVDPLCHFCVAHHARCCGADDRGSTASWPPNPLPQSSPGRRSDLTMLSQSSNCTLGMQGQDRGPTQGTRGLPATCRARPL